MLSRLSTRRIYQWRPHSIRKPKSGSNFRM
jgi:hypothetical protein